MKTKKLLALASVMALIVIVGAGCPPKHDGPDYDLETPPAEPDPAREMPGRDAQVKMARQAVLALNEAAMTGDYSRLHSMIASDLAREVSAQELSRAFHDFEALRLDLGQAAEVDPVFFEEPYLDHDNLLNLVGEFPITPTPVDFKIKYQLEQDGWKIHTLNVQPVAPPRQPPPGDMRMPSMEELAGMADTAILAVAHGVRFDEFDLLYNLIADQWKQQTTPAKLARAFDQFKNKDIVLEQVADVKPQFTSDPAIDRSGTLKLSGVYPLPSGMLLFRLEYIMENQVWKLSSIELKA